MNIDEYLKHINEFVEVANVYVAIETSEDSTFIDFDNGVCRAAYYSIQREYERLVSLLEENGNYFESLQTGEKIRVEDNE